jgi:hypothetical protein
VIPSFVLIEPDTVREITLTAIGPANG